MRSNNSGKKTSSNHKMKSAIFLIRFQKNALMIRFYGKYMENNSENNPLLTHPKTKKATVTCSVT